VWFGNWLEKKKKKKKCLTIHSFLMKIGRRGPTDSPNEQK